TGLEGMHVFKEGNPAVIEKLTAAGRMLASGKVEHSYQHCWRCRNPIAYRATEQWFLSVTHDGLREKLLKVIKDVKWVPGAGEGRISGMISGRPDWCLSRQRLWGTPIPIFWCLDCGEPMAESEVLEALEKKVAAEGSDFWFTDQKTPVILGKGDWSFTPAKVCSKCGKNSFRRETDILDVWMDSGASWLAVLGEDAVPCDLYLEGSDQHRGWFQSSLVMATAITGAAPYKAVLTHGFVLDDKGRAMSKSLGNVVSPQKVIDKLGADVLRLWVALADYSDDVRLSDKLLAGPTDIYRKLRNTFKYLLGNTFDFDPTRSRRGYADLPELERFILKRLSDLESTVRANYQAFAFRKAAIALVDFCNLTLSAFYLDVRKDALYTLKSDDPLRRSAQTVMWECLVRITNLASPVLSYTCEEVWQELRRGLSERKSGLKIEESVFLHDLEAVPAEWNDPALAQRWETFLKFRVRVLKALEEARAAKKIGAPLQAKGSVGPAGEAEKVLLSEFGPESLAELCIVSAFELSGAPEPRVEKAPGEKCPRCWRYRTDSGTSKEDPALCARCVSQLSS
ncbi:MAG: class I tRNA ligase family protein, partial [Elusimicrobiota bacterium]